jgi:hypothetical protein
MEVVLGRGEYVEADLVGKHDELARLVEHLLVALVVPPDRPQPPAVLERAGYRRQHEELGQAKSRFCAQQDIELTSWASRAFDLPPTRGAPYALAIDGLGRSSDG